MFNIRFVIWLTTMSLLFNSGTLHAAPAAPPNFVYRSTTQTPGDAFSYGMRPYGSNYDLYDHGTGASCKKKTTAFVATSRSEEFVRTNWAADGLWLEPASQREIYIYRIRATSNFYSLRESLLVVGQSIYTSLANSPYSRQEEWIADNGIVASQIEYADVYERGATPRTLRYVRQVRNPGYIPANTTGNPFPFPSSGTPQTTPQFHAFFPSLGMNNSLTACFSACTSAQGSPRAISGVGPTCSDRTFTAASFNPVQALNTISKQINTVYAPWQEQRRDFSQYHRRTKPSFCLTIDAGNTDVEYLNIRCNATPKDFDSIQNIRVYLKARGKVNTWVDTFFDVKVISGEANLRLTPKDIPVVGTKYKLSDYGYTIADVFSSRNGSWWSEINVIPEYPAIPPKSFFSGVSY